MAGSMSRRGSAVRHTMRSKRRRAALAPVHRMRWRGNLKIELPDPVSRFCSGRWGERVGLRMPVRSPRRPLWNVADHPGRWCELPRPETDTCWAGLGFKHLGSLGDVLEVGTVGQFGAARRPLCENLACRVVDLLVGPIAPMSRVQ